MSVMKKKELAFIIRDFILPGLREYKMPKRKFIKLSTYKTFIFFAHIRKKKKLFQPYHTAINYVPHTTLKRC